MAGMSTAPVWNIAGGPGRVGLFRDRVSVDHAPDRRLQARGAVQASVVFDSDDRLFVADMAGWIQAFNAKGKAQWRRQLTGGMCASPAVNLEKGIIFAGTLEGWIYALRVTDGSGLWQRKLPTKSDARVLSDLLYIPSRKAVALSSWGGQFLLLDSASGDTRQTWEAGLYPQSAATADQHGNIYCLRAIRGEGVAFVCVSNEGKETVLHCEPESRRGAHRMLTAAAPVVDEVRGVSYFVVNGDREGELNAWSLSERRHLWQETLSCAVRATPALGPSGDVLLAGLDGSIYSISPTGDRVFQYSSGADYLLSGVVSDANGNTYVGDPLGRLHVVKLGGDGKPVFEATRSIQARPAFDRRGDLYVPCTDRTVYVFRHLDSN